MPEIRKDPITGSWVVSAPERAHRPQPGRTAPEIPASGRCPFCAGNEADTPAEVFSLRAPKTKANERGWSVRVVPNRYPAFIQSMIVSSQSKRSSKRTPALGAHEVVIETPDHVEKIERIDVDQWMRIVHAYRQRTRALRGDARWRYVLIFKNQGISAGATLAHVHSQITALPVIPPERQRQFARARRFYREHRSCASCMMLACEIDGKKRLIHLNKYYAVFCPMAARVPFETWIMPRLHRSLFSSADDKDALFLARALRDIFRRLEKALNNSSLNFVIHSGPLRLGENPYYHWHLEILPRLAQSGGFEWGSGSYINVITPEDAAASLRGVLA